MPEFRAVEAIVTDIEGTTSSIDFVKTVLFPYAERALPAFVRGHLDEPDVATALDQTANESGIARDNIDALIAQLLDWSRADRKITPLKALQGLIWRRGYERGDYRAHVYTDAAEQLRAWHTAGIPLYVYSSGSIAAQKLFFRYSEAGDLTALFNGNFDTTIGGKREIDSYRKIAAAIGREPQRLLFLSDVVEELDAAHAAGFQTCWLQRPEDGFAELQPHAVHPVAHSFDQITTTHQVDQRSPMSNATPRMTNLFLQLGLDASEQAIAKFIKTHQLPADVHLANAPWWSDAQRQFLTEQINSDAVWAIVVDQLNESLHEDAVRASSGAK